MLGPFRVLQLLLLNLFFHLLAEASTAGFTPPGKPKLTSCRSPEKETFTCWWDPGSDGGLPTTYSLYYRLENSETVYECPDYRTAGENSCFFSKNDTTIWVNYNITVVATNELGSNHSDSVEVDVAYIVQPNTPVNVTVAVKEDDQGPYVRVSWEKPPKADTSSGWITLVYQLRVKLEKERDWEEYDAGYQKVFKVFSPRSGGTYMVQVRCKPDHGFWSEWSNTSYVTVPDYLLKERYLWIVIGTISLVIFIILTWMINLKRNSVKHFLLPPVPGPKIKGFDKQQLKNGKAEDAFNALVIQGFLPASDYEDLLVEYLEVYDNDNQELVDGGKDLQDGLLKSKCMSDNDSGRGSCDSHILLMEKCGEGKEELPVEHPRPQEVVGKCSGPMEDLVANTAELNTSLVHTLAPRFSPSLPSQINKKGSPGTPTPISEKGEKQKRELHNSSPALSGYSHINNEFDMNGLVGKRDPAAPAFRSMEYVEVQKVSQQNVLLLRPLGPTPVQLAAEDYSKVKGVTSDNVLLLQSEQSRLRISDCQERGEQEESCPRQQHPQAGKLAIHLPSNVIQGGYVDSATMIY
ncbi:prolactin receptor a [Denticeps clupeoides]|uniref:Prolactin receptor n=1 Tax=Denticeps clupeoides TaxID=299321 RepID=A0AAY4DF82_9TELE|nr:prolactin receptor [Denticeps clupeoides]